MAETGSQIGGPARMKNSAKELNWPTWHHYLQVELYMIAVYEDYVIALGLR
jgi:hypothetical protein